MGDEGSKTFFLGGLKIIKTKIIPGKIGISYETSEEGTK